MAIQQGHRNRAEGEKRREVEQKYEEGKTLLGHGKGKKKKSMRGGYVVGNTDRREDKMAPQCGRFRRPCDLHTWHWPYLANINTTAVCHTA